MYGYGVFAEFFEEALVGIFVFFILVAPLAIQLIIYPLSRLCLKKAPSTLMWWICFGVNNFLLGLIVLFYLVSLDETAENMDILGSIILIMIWMPSYICVLIWGIVKSIVSAAKAFKKSSDDNITVDDLY